MTSCVGVCFPFEALLHNPILLYGFLQVKTTFALGRATTAQSSSPCWRRCFEELVF
uniref:Uncharacterized protein n=1 Tax=Oryza brachyantha TaxID=4533 RepID=J3L0G9_ORYBR